jgi:putative ABC transport system permease protein
MLPILMVLIVLIFVVGAVVVGVTIYTATVEKEREYGVMKALGSPNKHLLAVVAQQTLACCLLGFLVGELAVLLASRLAVRVVPQFVTLIRWEDALIVLAATTVMGVLGAYLPVQRVLRVDPLRVFKA